MLQLEHIFFRDPFGVSLKVLLEEISLDIFPHFLGPASPFARLHMASVQRFVACGRAMSLGSATSPWSKSHCSACAATTSGAPRRVLHQSTINADEPQIKQDILRMILQYLQDEGYTASSMTIQDETNVKLLEQVSQRAHVKRMRRAILDGDWLEVEKLCAKSGFAKSKSFLYAAYRAQYLELIEGQEYQKAFTHLTKRLKPLESSAAS